MNGFPLQWPPSRLPHYNSRQLGAPVGLQRSCRRSESTPPRKLAAGGRQEADNFVTFCDKLDNHHQDARPAHAYPLDHVQYCYTLT